MLEILTKQEALALHKELWNAVATFWKEEKSNANLSNEDIPVKDHILTILQIEAVSRYGLPDCSCWCCKYNEQQNTLNDLYGCNYCPIDWENKYSLEYGMSCMNSFYGRYIIASHWITKHYWANRIANLKEAAHD